MPAILIADDNEQITSVLEEYSKKEGYRPLLAADGEAALALFYSESPDVVLLDVMMPRMDGFSVCKEIRRTSNVPVLMVTARGEDYEKIMGLDIGADDYIVKPFSPAEVMARVRSILRRIGQDEQKTVVHDSLRVTLDTYTASIDGELLLLTKKELEILWTLASNPDKVFTRDNLLDSLWGQDYFGDTRTVDSHIKRLRTKIDHYPHPSWEIKTIWGVGYKFEAINP